MPDEINPELFARLAQLAALELDPRESEYLRAQLNVQLRAIAELERIAVPDDVPPAAHGVPFPPDIRPPLRIDRAAVDPILAARRRQRRPSNRALSSPRPNCGMHFCIDGCWQHSLASAWQPWGQR